MVDNANATQRQASAAIDSGDDFSHKSIQAIDNYDNFDQTIMGIEASQTEEHLNRAPLSEMEPGAQTEVTFPQDFTTLSLIVMIQFKGLKFQRVLCLMSY